MSRVLDTHDYVSKILLVGDAGSGKSALINRYIDGEYNDNYYNTIGIDFKIKTFEINNKKIKINIWDTAGQEKFKSLVTSYYRNSDVIILVFDITNETSLRHIDSWYSDIQYYCTNQNVSLYLVGTKADLDRTILKDKVNIDNNYIKEKCEKYNMKYFITSAKKNYNINELFNDILLEIYRISKIKDQEKVLNICEPTNIETSKSCFNCTIM